MPVRFRVSPTGAGSWRCGSRGSAMLVLFRGLSEYKRNFKWKSSEFCSPSQQQKPLWAGLRSDQFGIMREPKFIAKRRVPYHNPQISKSLEWTADCDLNDLVETEAAELHTDNSNNNVNQEKLEIPEGPRLPPKVQSDMVDSSGETALALAEINMKKSPSDVPPNQNEACSSEKKESEKMGNGIHRALQRRADVEGCELLAQESSALPWRKAWGQDNSEIRNLPLGHGDQMNHPSMPCSSMVIPCTQLANWFLPHPLASP